MRTKDLIRIAVTGGPSAGKTTLIESLRKDFIPELGFVPEAASLLYRGGFPRMDHVFAKKCAQLAIYHTQRQLENVAQVTYPEAKVIVCDRGSLDSLAYWPGSAADFFKEVKSSEKKELARYKMVIHLDTPDDPDHYDRANHIRTESFEQARALNQKIKRVWENHPNRVILPPQNQFLEKMTIAELIIRDFLKS
jgi:predicted ATPase